MTGVYRVAEEKESKVVATGFWLYDGAVRHEVRVVASNYDRRYEAALELDKLGGDGDIYWELPDGRGPLGPSGWIFEIEPHWFQTFLTLEDAKRWVDDQPWGPVSWEPEDILRGH